MTRYTPDHHKPRAQPAYSGDSKSSAFLPPSTSRQRTQSLDTLPLPRTHSATTGSSEDPLRVDVERPIDPNRIGIVSREQYPPCPHCEEPVITIRTLGPHLHAAGPCGCPLEADTVAAMLCGANR
ncbi:hypothetical protein [Halovivax cerinus]|uniref:Uncharacterized protein n=1 Tax=Halovivax cerinus TaxID=1487865 RepID=A0ABD5NKC5_9EURY|nr:hypothetical protein [Halovivax cerinus]